MTCKHPKGHKFQKFDESSLFCERCGERRVIASHWTPAPYVYPWYTWPWAPGVTWPPYIVWSDAGTTTTSGTITTSGWTLQDDNTQSTLTDGSES